MDRIYESGNRLIALEQPIESLRAQIYLKMSPTRKWEEFNRMRKIAWDLKRAAVRAKYSDWDEREINNTVRKIFLYAVT